MRRTVLALATFALLAAGSAFGQGSVVNHGLSNITGTGARALGMGGAFVALADDATAASWNPAGLAQLTRPEVSLVYDWSSGPFDTYRNLQRAWSTGRQDLIVSSNEGHISGNFLGFASATYPFLLGGQRLVAQVSYRRMAKLPDLKLNYLANYQYQLVNPSRTATGSQTIRQTDLWTGGFDSTSLSFATELGSHLRVGVSASYIDTSNGENYTYAYAESTDWVRSAYTQKFYDDSSFTAWQGDIGVQWTPWEPLTFGAVYHTGFTATFKEASAVSYLPWDDTFWGGPPPPPSSADYRTKVHWPDGYQLGVAWRATDRLILAFDYGSTRWSAAKLDTWESPGWDDNGNPVVYVYQPMPYPAFTKQHDSHTERVGGEYTFYLGKRVFMPVRAGYFRDRQLAALPGFYEGGVLAAAPPTFDGYTLGAGVTVGGLQFDFAWVKTKGEQSGTANYSQARGDGITIQNVLSRKVTLDADRYLASMIVRF